MGVDLSRIRNILCSVVRSSLNFLYPPHCLHCREGLLDGEQLLCSPCSEILELLDPENRCSGCFSPLETLGVAACRECLEASSPLQSVASVFDYLGPAASIIKKFKYANQPFLAKGVAAFMVGQLFRLDWPVPDLLVPVPISFVHWIDRGYNQSFLLANEVSAMIGVPVVEALKRQSCDYSQAGLSRDQRQQLGPDSIWLKKSYSFEKKNILLIDDVFTTGSTLRRSAEAITKGSPLNIYGLTFCKAS